MLNECQQIKELIPDKGQVIIAGLIVLLANLKQQENLGPVLPPATGWMDPYWVNLKSDKNSSMEYGLL